jgi:putative transposase
MSKMMFHPFFLMLAHWVNSHLIEEIQYLKAENQILRSRIKGRIVVTDVERNRLLRFGKPLGARLKGLITIVTYETFRRWVNGRIYKGKKSKAGRPSISAETRELIIRIAKENAHLGYHKIRGELMKLNIKVGRTTIQTILRGLGIEPSPLRRDSRWTDFIRTHMETLIACDFFTKEIWTLRGRVTVYVFFFIELGTRRVHLAGMTRYPKRRWVERRAAEVLDTMKNSGFEPKYLIRDRDGKFSDEFDSIFQSNGLTVVKTPAQNPSCNIYAERWVWSVKHECLNYFSVFGKHHLKYIVETYVDYYNRYRPHQGLGNKPICGIIDSSSDGEIKSISILGGMFHHYQRKAA